MEWNWIKNKKGGNMLKNEIDVLVIAHNICVAFAFLNAKRQEYFIRQLRLIEKEVCEQVRAAGMEDGKT